MKIKEMVRGEGRPRSANAEENGIVVADEVVTS